MAGMPALCVGDFCETKSEWEAFSPVWGIFLRFWDVFSCLKQPSAVYLGHIDLQKSKKSSIL